MATDPLGVLQSRPASWHKGFSAQVHAIYRVAIDVFDACRFRRNVIISMRNHHRQRRCRCNHLYWVIRFFPHWAKSRMHAGSAKSCVALQCYRPCRSSSDVGMVLEINGILSSMAALYRVHGFFAGRRSGFGCQRERIFRVERALGRILPPHVSTTFAVLRPTPAGDSAPHGCGRPRH